MSSRRTGPKGGGPHLLPSGYEIQLLRKEMLGGSRCYRANFLDVSSARDGVAWIDADSGLPFRIEGPAVPRLSAWVATAFFARCKSELVPAGAGAGSARHGARRAAAPRLVRRGKQRRAPE